MDNGFGVSSRAEQVHAFALAEPCFVRGTAGRESMFGLAPGSIRLSMLSRTVTLLEQAGFPWDAKVGILGARNGRRSSPEFIRDSEERIGRPPVRWITLPI